MDEEEWMGVDEDREQTACKQEEKQHQIIFLPTHSFICVDAAAAAAMDDVDDVNGCGSFLRYTHILIHIWMRLGGGEGINAWMDGNEWKDEH